jgi:hypothetical protein
LVLTHEKLYQAMLEEGNERQLDSQENKTKEKFHLAIQIFKTYFSEPASLYPQTPLHTKKILFKKFLFKINKCLY